MPRISTLVKVDVDNTSCIEIPVEVRYRVDGCGWTAGCVAVQCVCHQYSGLYEFEAKVCMTEGGISNLYIVDANTKTEVVVYDRGWYHKPQRIQDHAALNALLKIFGHCQSGKYLINNTIIKRS